jgi:hypothetical protein
MLKDKIIIIDIRTSEEIYAKRAISYSDNTILIFIPVSHIKFNQKMIRQISQKNKIYILCKKSIRSSMVKKTFFPTDRNIISIDGGINQLEKMNDLMRNLKLVIYQIKIFKKTDNKLSFNKLSFNKLSFNKIYYILIIVFFLYYMYKK